MNEYKKITDFNDYFDFDDNIIVIVNAVEKYIGPFIAERLKKFDDMSIIKKYSLFIYGLYYHIFEMSIDIINKSGIMKL